MPGSWNDVRAELLWLERDPAGPLRRFPNPREDIARTPPFHLRLAAWADVVAADLHRRFGETVDLTVGVLHYPDRSLTDGWDAGREWRGAPGIEEAGLSVRLEPLTVVSGHSGRSTLLVHNGSEVPVTLRTNGRLTAVVTDPVTGDVVGRRAGFRTLKLVRFTIGPDATQAIPVAVGTDSVVPALGYAVPAGAWTARAVLRLDDGRQLVTPPLPVTVTGPESPVG